MKFPNAVLCAALAILAHGAPAQDAAPTELQPIEVKADPFGRAPDDLVQPVQVLTGEELDRRRADSIGETLSSELGVSASDFGAGASRPVIRGQGGPRVLLLENGLRTLDVSDVSADHAVSVDPVHAEQIEIIKGPATLIYGSGASAGVVNVINDRLNVEPGFKLSGGGAYGGNASRRNGHVDLHYGGEAWHFHADGGWRKAGDYDIPGFTNAGGGGNRGMLLNSFAESESGALALSHRNDGGERGIAVSTLRSKYGIPAEATAFIDLKQTRVEAYGSWLATGNLFDRLRIKGAFNDYEHTEFEDPVTPGTVFGNRAFEARIEAGHRPIKGLRGVAGLQLGQRDLEAVGAEAYIPPVKTQSAGLFLVEERKAGFGRLEGGARVEYQEGDPTVAGNSCGTTPVRRGHTPVSLAAGSVVELGASHHLRLNFARSQRAPASEELFACGPHIASASFERGSDALDVETAYNAELGLDRHEGRWSWTLNLFYNPVDDYIFLQEVDAGLNADGSGTQAADGDADTVDENGTFTPAGEFLLVDYRQADARFFGVEAETGFALLHGPAQLDLRLFGDLVRGELDRGGDLPRITPSRVGLALDASHGALSGSVEWSRVGGQRRIASLETATEGYDLLSADLRYRLGLARAQSILFLSGRNLLDEEVRRHTSFIKDVAPLPGASVVAGFEVTFY